IRWGLADFRYRFQREAEALWLPETACNDRVMSALIDEGLRYVILAPHQAARVRSLSDNSPLPLGEGPGERVWRVSPHPNPLPEGEGGNASGEWHEVNENTIDSGIPYRYFHPNRLEKSIALFFYDGP